MLNVLIMNGHCVTFSTLVCKMALVNDMWALGNLITYSIAQR